MATYIMTCRDDRYWIVGPFADHAAAGAWNCLDKNNPSDDPRWQVLDLINVATGPVVLSPAMATELANNNAY